jgi:hypothetical protein
VTIFVYSVIKIKIQVVCSKFKAGQIHLTDQGETADEHDSQMLYEPRRDKTNIVGLRPAWIQTSLRIRPD